MRRDISIGLTPRLVIVLLAFGALPVAASIALGYVASRSVITDRAADALAELTKRQATHLSTELDRQHLIVRTITGQLQASLPLTDRRADALATLLRQSLPEDGVFDGLRLVTPDGEVLASVALREAAPHWPPRAPAADWRSERVVVHREGGRVLAYLVAAPLNEGPVGWLEGHVQAEDFGRLFGLGEHMAAGIEFAIVDHAERLVFTGHPHAAEGLLAAARRGAARWTGAERAEIGDAPFLVAVRPVEAAGWLYVAGLPLEQALAPLAQLRNGALAATGVLLALIALTAVLAARSISAPLRELADAARRLGRSRTYEPVLRTGSGEVGALVESFNRMGEDLVRSRAEIERLHAQEMERAQQLATVGELASAVAHEIRNPLTGVLGALELALGRLPPEDAMRPLLTEADRQLRRIEATTTQLLRYARPPELREVVVDVGSLVERAARVVETRANAAGIDLTVEASDSPARVRVDPELMVQVLVNLMLNGIEAMGRGGRLSVWIARRTPEVWIGVRDTGPGVPPEQRSVIFKPFYTTKHQGTGLGLSISRQIVARHGGSLRYEDTPGGGATFVVALPLVPEGDVSS